MYLALSIAAASGVGTPRVRQVAATTLAAPMGAGTLANLASSSPVERALWTPTTLAMGVLAWRVRGE